MINRDDMLELTRRMTPKRTCFSRVAGCYVTRPGDIDGTFNIHFGKLSEAEKKKNLDIAKTIPFAKTNEQLKEYAFPKGKRRNESMWALLTGMKEKGLKDDALLSILYEVIIDNYEAYSDYAIMVFFGTYDIPVKGTDGAWNEGSEEVYDFIIGAIAPYTGDYEVGIPDFGFLYPAFSDRSADKEKIDIYNIDPENENKSLMKLILNNIDETKPVVPLIKIIEAVEMADDNWKQYFDLELMETVSIAQDPGFIDDDEENERMLEQIEMGWKTRYFGLPDKYDIHEYNIMENFIRSLPESRIQKELADAIRGSGAFRRFKDKLAGFGLLNDWYDYQSEAYRKIAIEWCEDNGFEYEES